MKKLLTPKMILGTLVVTVYLAVMVSSMKGIGLTDDVDFYSSAALSYSEWWGKVFSGLSHFRFDAFQRGTVDQYWSVNHEHPPFAKLAMGLSHAVFTNLLHLTNTIDGLRMGTILLSTLLALLLFSAAWDEIGRAAAVFAPLSLLTMPRFFFHSHVETLDVPVATTFFLAFYAFWKSLNSWRWGIFAGFAFGLALSTKLNAPFLLVLLVLWWGTKNADRFDWVRGRGFSVPPIPLWLPSMAVLGCITFYLLWPWVWFDTTARLNNYFGFHLKHYGILFSYFGRIYNENPFAPWHAPWVMAGITTPVVTLAAALLGTGMVIRNAFRRRPDDPAFNRRRDFGNLVALAALVTIGTVAFLGTPKYGGVKLFLPFFPFLALLGGMGVQFAAEKVLGFIKKASLKPVAEIGLAAVLIIPGGIGLAKVHPYELSYYNVLIGGLPGAANTGMERQYYDVFYRPLVDWMNLNLPAGAAVTFLPNNKEYVRSAPWYRRDGILRADLRITQFNDAQFLVLTHEERWPEWPELKRRYSILPVVHEISVEGVPLLTVFRLRG
jgi:4-amino-4-deoxy-L-arabinose transferase-like glycosyltransferase